MVTCKGHYFSGTKLGMLGTILAMLGTINCFLTILGMYGDYVVYGDLQGTLLFQGQSWESSVQYWECSVQ